VNGSVTSTLDVFATDGTLLRSISSGSPAFDLVVR